MRFFFYGTLMDPDVRAIVLGREASLAAHVRDAVLFDWERRATQGVYKNVAAVGFEAGLDIRNGNTAVDIRSSVVWDSTGVGVIDDIAYPETTSTDPDKDDDGALKEVDFWNLSSRKNGNYDPAIDCFGASPNFTPSSSLTTDAATPPSDGFFDTDAKFIGAIKDSASNWATGAWVNFDPN